MTNSEIVRGYLKAVESLESGETLASFLAPEVTFHELPNLIVPNGRVRNAAEMRTAFAMGRQLLTSQTFRIIRMIEMGDEVAAELEWTGVLAVPFRDLQPGSQLRANIGMFITLKDGRIVSQRNYDCYPPFE